MSRPKIPLETYVDILKTELEREDGQVLARLAAKLKMPSWKLRQVLKDSEEFYILKVQYNLVFVSWDNYKAALTKYQDIQVSTTAWNGWRLSGLKISRAPNRTDNGTDWLNVIRLYPCQVLPLIKELEKLL